MEKKYIKCASIYYQNSQTSQGNFSGSGLGVGMSGLGVGVASGTTSSFSQTKLAEMFTPVKNTKVFKGDPMLWLGLTTVFLYASFHLDRNLKEVSEIALKVSTFLGFMGAGFCLAKMFRIMEGKPKYTEKELEKFEDNFNKAFYDVENHEIFINENKKIPATRDNFLKLMSEE